MLCSVYPPVTYLLEVLFVVKDCLLSLVIQYIRCICCFTGVNIRTTPRTSVPPSLSTSPRASVSSSQTSSFQYHFLVWLFCRRLLQECICVNIRCMKLLVIQSERSRPEVAKASAASIALRHAIWTYFAHLSIRFYRTHQSSFQNTYIFPHPASHKRCDQLTTGNPEVLPRTVYILLPW